MSHEKSGLTSSNLTMMALGTVIGGSFFLGSAIGIKSAGPAIIISYLIGGLLVYMILFALSEMTVANSAPGSFRTFAEQIFGPAAGFITGWVYWTGLVLAMSSEAIAVSALISQWIPGISVGLLGSLVIIFITLANLLGADRLSKLESGLAAIKLFAIAAFIVLALLLAAGLLPGKPATGLGKIAGESLAPGGLGGIAGSMLIVMFTYAGFEIIGLAASESSDPHRTVPRAIKYTVLTLTGLYTTAIALVMLFLSANEVSEDKSPFVDAMEAGGINWAGQAINIVLVTAIISTMLASTFGLARMLRSLASEGHAPGFLNDKGDIPRRCILFSGLAMLAGLLAGFLLPKGVYIFLVSSGGFSLLFTYLVIAATHNRYRKINGCPPAGKCQLKGYPFTSWLSIAAITAIIFSMPLIPGQGSGLAAGLILVAFYWLCYMLFRYGRTARG